MSTAQQSNGESVPVSKVKAIVLTSTGSGSDYSNLQVKEENYPKLEKEDQVIVRMKAVGLNFAELMQRQGLYKPQTKTPYTPGYEGAGLVEEIGTGVTEFAKNDRVIVFNGNSVWKEVVILPKTHLIRIPDNMSYEEAAGLIVNYLTAYQLLFRMTNLMPGDSVLIHMAAGGVGMAATQLCRTVPNVTIFGTASPGKHDALRENGVDHPIDYTKNDYMEEIRKISPDGVDIVLDPLNGENSIKGYDLLRPLGRIVHYGAASMTQESRSLLSAFKTWWKCLSINSLEIISDNKSVSGYHLGRLLDNKLAAKKNEQDLNTLLKFYQEGKIKIKLDSTYAFSKVGEAMKRMHDRKNVGKIILKPDCEMPEPEAEAPVVVSTEQVEILKTTTPPSVIDVVPEHTLDNKTSNKDTTSSVPEDAAKPATGENENQAAPTQVEASS